MSGRREGGFRVFAVLRDATALARLERVFSSAPDRELVGTSDRPDAALPSILNSGVRSVYVDADLQGARKMIVALTAVWHGFVRAFSLLGKHHQVAPVTVVPFEELVGVLEGIYTLKLETGMPALSLEFQNLILDTIYQRGPDEGFVILGYDGDVVFYGPRAARFGGLPYPPPPGFTEADVDHLIRRARRRERVRSDDGRVLAERFWIPVRDRHGAG